jgi:hypothetical protein
MDRPSGYECVDMEGALARLAESTDAQRRVRGHFGDQDFEAALRAMRNGQLSERLGAEAHDFFADEIPNEGATHWSGSVQWGDGECFGTQVRGLGGVYFVSSVDWENTGYFLSVEDAVSWIHDIWDRVYPE